MDYLGSERTMQTPSARMSEYHFMLTARGRDGGFGELSAHMHGPVGKTALSGTPIQGPLNGGAADWIKTTKRRAPHSCVVRGMTMLTSRSTGDKFS